LPWLFTIFKGASILPGVCFNTSDYWLSEQIVIDKLWTPNVSLSNIRAGLSEFQGLGRFSGNSRLKINYF
jgi:hypothetical protein